MADDAAIGWQEATARLTAEKGRAETAAKLVKRFGDARDQAMGELAYAEGKAATDALLAGLTVALAGGEAPESLESLQARLAQAVNARDTLTDMARRLIDAGGGFKAVEWAAVLDVATNLLPTLKAAVVALWNRREERDALLRQTITTQLDAARWADFASLEAP
jgi:hypothetical protein